MPSKRGRTPGLALWPAANGRTRYRATTKRNRVRRFTNPVLVETRRELSARRCRSHVGTILDRRDRCLGHALRSRHCGCRARATVLHRQESGSTTNHRGRSLNDCRTITSRRLPLSCDDDRFILARPWWRCDGNSGQRFVTAGSKLELRTQRDGKANTRVHIDNHHAPVLLTPHLATAGDEVPDFFDGPMHNRFRCLARCKREVRHSPKRQSEQDPYIGPVRGNRRALPWQMFRVEIRHPSPFAPYTLLVPAYSYRSASIGSSRAARRAG
jgi:hypothetical protein